MLSSFYTCALDTYVFLYYCFLVHPLLPSLALGDAFISDPFNGLGVEFNGMRLQKQYNSSSNSISSSISSISRTSSESEHATAVGAGDLEADADSLTCRQSGLSSNDQFENDGPRKVLLMPFGFLFFHLNIRTGNLCIIYLDTFAEMAQLLLVYFS